MSGAYVDATTLSLADQEALILERLHRAADREKQDALLDLLNLIRKAMRDDAAQA